MKITSLLFFLFISFCSFSQQTILIDDSWKFHRGDAVHAESKRFNDSAWRNVDLPHDYSIEDLPGTNSPFNPDVVNGVSIGFTTSGTAWYRKELVISSEQKNNKVCLQFDGVCMNADVWLNGIHLGNHPYGYTSFYYDISDKINWHGKNILAVQVKNNNAASRWYSGSGIERHIWLKYLQPVHLKQWGNFISTSGITNTSAQINIVSTVLNETKTSREVKISTQFFDKKNNKVADILATQIIGENASVNFSKTVFIKNPLLWSTEDPVLYKAVTKIYAEGKLSDSSIIMFGIRSISFSSENGFLLNRKSMKLKGACFHNDNGPIGARAYDAAEERKVFLLRSSGFNAIRCSHNPPAEAFLNACDKYGMLVIDEAFDCWNTGKNDSDYHLYFNDWWQRDLQSMLLRDRNHPCIIMWSIGNEIPNMDNPSVADTARLLADYVHSFDSTRPVTAAVNGVSESKDNFFSSLDVCGYNYSRDKYEIDHARIPNRIMFGTESYALTQFDYWMSVADHPWVIGDFIWTGFDYIGEASIGWLGYEQRKDFYPWNLAYCGDIDICGWKRPQSFYRDALLKKDQLSIFVKPLKPSFPLNLKKEDWSIWNWDDVLADWNWKGNEDSIFDVNVYSSCDEVELFLNGKSLGKKQTNRSTKFIAVFKVPYKAGELKAIGYVNHRQVNVSVLKTADEVSEIKLSAEKNMIAASNEDLCYITVELKDKNGNTNPKAENEIHFSVSGPATIIGVGNANPVSLESYQLPQRKGWHGKCLVVLKSTHKHGNIVLTAVSEGLQSGMINIISK